MNIHQLLMKIAVWVCVLLFALTAWKDAISAEAYIVDPNNATVPNAVIAYSRGEVHQHWDNPNVLVRSSPRIPTGDRISKYVRWPNDTDTIQAVPLLAITDGALAKPWYFRKAEDRVGNDGVLDTLVPWTQAEIGAYTDAQKLVEKDNRKVVVKRQLDDDVLINALLSVLQNPPSNGSPVSEWKRRLRLAIDSEVDAQRIRGQ